MATLSSLFALFACAYFMSSHVAMAWFFGDPNWSTLRVTWGYNLLSKHVFELMPLTEQDALDQGYIQIDTECTGKFLGYRYMKPGNISLVLLYGVNGKIAGIQSGYPTAGISPTKNRAWFAKVPILVDDNLNDVDTFTATAYFVDPAIICTSGRTNEEVEKNPTGDELSIQKGPDPLNDLIKIPNNENEIGNMEEWTKGKCFKSMGIHYWYNTTQDMNCDKFLPLFLLYNREKLTGFGFAIPNFYDDKRYEHPPKDVLGKFFVTVPDCLNTMFDEAKGFSTMHVYMNVEPWNLVC